MIKIIATTTTTTTTIIISIITIDRTRLEISSQKPAHL